MVGLPQGAFGALRQFHHFSQSLFRKSTELADVIVRRDHQMACRVGIKVEQHVVQAPALKKGIFLAGTSTLAPVLGFRPMRGLRFRVRKLPKPRISILSPVRRARTILSKIVSTICSESLRVISTARETSSISSALVISN